MSERVITGTIANHWRDNESVRVVSVDADRTIVDETVANAEGEWSLKVADHVEWIVAQTTGSRIAAVVVQPQETMELVFPDLVHLGLEFDGVNGPAALWLDPLHLEGFPDELLWVLRAHAGDIVDLHIGELQLPPLARNLEIQPGRYRFSGGRFSISDEIINTNLRLVRGLEQTTGTLFEGGDGAVDVDLLQSSRLLLTFGPLE